MLRDSKVSLVLSELWPTGITEFYYKGAFMKTVAVFATIAGLAVLGAVPNKEVEVKKVPVTHTRADSGVLMFKQYCATCHGLDGKGQGPAAPALKLAPADLTMLKQKNEGKFPDNKVMRTIEGTNDIRAHGTSEMPLWGPIFHSLDPNNAPVTKLRITNLTKYIESMQK